MSDNDKNIKKILESEKIPSELEPESVKIMLDKFAGKQKRKITVKRRMMKIMPVAAAFVVTLSTLAVYSLSVNHDFDKCDDVPEMSDETVELESLKSAEDYSDVYNYFKQAEKKSYAAEYADEVMDEAADGIETGGIAGEEEVGMGVNGSSDNSYSGSSQTDYSDTYNQEEGVLEADIVKTDGNYIYYANGDTVNAAVVSNGNFLANYQIQRVNENIEDMYLYNNMLIIISDENYCYGDDMCDYAFIEDTKTCVSFYSTVDSPELMYTYTQDGWYNDVRLTSDGYMYLITNDEKYYDSEDLTADDYQLYIPKYTVNGSEKYVESGCIMIPDYYPDDFYSYFSFTNISAFNLNGTDICQPTDIKAIAGYSDTIYCSSENLYVTFGYEDTEITRFAISEGTIIPQASGKVKGYVRNQFSMSEYDGYFRIAVTEDTWRDSWSFFGMEFGSDTDYNNTVYVLDMNLNTVGSITDFGLNETIKSVNFSGDKAYVVTFRQTDPLYAIDLSNPQNPVIMDEYKINGYSSYMQKWGDGLLLGFGPNADEDGIVDGVKLTMFDNSDPDNLKELSTVEVTAQSDNEYISSDASWERKALIIDPEKNIIGFPVRKESWTTDYYDDDYDYDEYSREYFYEEYYAFYSFENGSLKPLGNIYYDQQANEEYYSAFDRAVIIGDYVYLLSGTQFKSADIQTFTDVKSVIFN